MLSIWFDLKADVWYSPAEKDQKPKFSVEPAK